VPSQLDVLPDVTRMLLASEGSTTILLESLLGTGVAVRVRHQEPVSAATLAPDVRDALGLDDEEWPVVRRSSLEAPDGRQVSHNVVTFRAEEAPWLLDSTGNVPIGHQLRARMTRQFRTVLATGTDAWPDVADGAVCAFKTYLIHCGQGVRIHVHERFSPTFVPVNSVQVSAGEA
jgi:chorismate-pyruvate lyase